MHIILAAENVTKVAKEDKPVVSRRRGTYLLTPESMFMLSRIYRENVVKYQLSWFDRACMGVGQWGGGAC